MDTIVRCECGEEAVVNTCSRFNDYKCTHCGEYFSIKYGKYTQRSFGNVEDIFVTMMRNRKEFVSRSLKGFW